MTNGSDSTDKDDATSQRDDTPYYQSPTGGWGSLKGIWRISTSDRPDPAVIETLARTNKPNGHQCTSCAWGKPRDPSPFEFCENGAKATVWDLTRDRCTPEFFSAHTVSSLRDWSDHDLEMQGRLTHPLRYDAASDRYVETSWSEAFDAIGRSLQAIEPKSAVFYTSGRAGLETSYAFALFARLYGHNNLPDSSNMCHETTSVGLPKLIGTSVGTCVLDDFEACDMLLFFGQNPGTNSPRMLNVVKQAVERGCRIFSFNPIRERGLIEFASPQNPTEMLSGKATQISERYLQVRAGGDIAALAGICKHALDLAALRDDALDRAFIDTHCNGFDAFRDAMTALSWNEIERVSGLDRKDLAFVADAYLQAERCIAVYGMGLTQQVHGFQNLAMVVNLLLLRGNIGKPGAGICPVRGHSNVQGQRTVGIAEKPELVPLDKLAEQFAFEPPRETGFTTAEVVEGLHDGSVRAFVSLGGNFARAIPDNRRTEPCWAKLDLNVQIATRLNRSHLLVGGNAWLLPCLVRAEEDRQANGPQAITLEDGLSHIHGSVGKREPASEHLKSEFAIVAGMAKTTVGDKGSVPWNEWTADYGRVRDAIAETFPDEFHDFNARMFEPGGFYRGNPARERNWQTASGRAEFTAPSVLSALGADARPDESDRFVLITLRSNDQFNTTIYGDSDRLRGLEGDRRIVMIHPDDMTALGLTDGERMVVVCAVDDGYERRVADVKAQRYDIPRGTVAMYFPEANPLIPVGRRDTESQTPAYKGTPVRLERA